MHWKILLSLTMKKHSSCLQFDVNDKDKRDSRKPLANHQENARHGSTAFTAAKSAVIVCLPIKEVLTIPITHTSFAKDVRWLGTYCRDKPLKIPQAGLGEVMGFRVQLCTRVF